MKLPNGENAEIADKLEAYSLNPLHREGRYKAACATSETALDRGDNGFGQVFVLRFPLTTDRGSAEILTAWIIRHGEDFPD